MADKLGISMSFLSSVENGKKSMPSEWITKIANRYQLNDAQKMEFDQSVAESEKGIAVQFFVRQLPTRTVWEKSTGDTPPTISYSFDGALEDTHV